MTDINRRRGLTFATLIALIALATLAAALTGCAVGPNYAKPSTAVTPQFEGATAAPTRPRTRRRSSGRNSAIPRSIS